MNKRKAFLSPAIIILITIWLQNNIRAASGNDIESIIKQYQQETKCENVSVVVFDNGEISYYGDSEGLYQIGSMTKAFTGLAIQKLIDEGLVNEDGVVSDYIEGFEAYYESAKADITVRDLIEQKSGYTNIEKDYPSATEAMTLSEWADSICGRELSFRPGTEYAYSNVNYNLLGLIIENVSEIPYRDYMEQEILIPLGLRNTFVGTPDDNRIIEGTRLGYRHVFEFPMSVKEASIPAGYFYSNAEDMGRWIDIWTESSDVPEDIKEALSKIGKQLKEEGDYYSGWELFADGVTGHSGGTPNYSSRLVMDEKNHTGVCVLSNLNVAATTDSLCNSILSIVSGNIPEKLNRDIWTIFDDIFVLVTVTGMFLFPVILVVKKRAVLIAFDVILIFLLTLVLILLPIIFGAGMKEIVFTWASWSLAGGLLTIAADILGATVKLLIGNKNADHNKTGKRQTADGYN
ncbi:MAG: beta-lactamase family protein [Lachnospiraceae bacterium]|nr:beta-lactamase family protein [Lachnospiraceae bacterium]